MWHCSITARIEENMFAVGRPGNTPIGLVIVSQVHLSRTVSIHDPDVTVLKNGRTSGPKGQSLAVRGPSGRDIGARTACQSSHSRSIEVTDADVSFPMLSASRTCQSDLPSPA